MITIVGNTQTLTPAFNEVNYYVDSDNKALEGFRYVIDVYDVETGDKIFESRVAPAFSTGYGEIFLSKILSNKVSFDCNFADISTALNSYFKYKIEIGEEYNSQWAYDDYNEMTTGTYAGFTKLFQSPTTTAHTFSVGDQINVMQTDGGILKPMLEGLFTVLEVVDAYTIVIDILWSEVGASSAMGGIIKYADNRKQITRDLAEQTAYVWNGALSFLDFRTYNENSFLIPSLPSSTTRKMLTNLPDNFYITETQDIFLNFFKSTADTDTINIYFQNSNGDVLSVTGGIWTNALGSQIAQVCVAGDNLPIDIAVSGSTPLVKSDTTYYDFWLVFGSTQLTKKYRVYIDRRCEIEEAQILFMDRLGSFVSYAFQLRMNETGDVKRDSYKKDLGGLVVDTFGYDSTDTGAKITAVSVDKVYTIRTNWMTYEMNVYFEELITSPVTFIKMNDVYQACEIINANFETERQPNKKMIRKTIQVRLANQNNVNV